MTQKIRVVSQWHITKLPLTVLCLICLKVFLCLIPSSSMAADGDQSLNWAVITATAADDRTADLILAKLLQIDGVRLVERSMIAKILDELQLDALALLDPQTATRFGKLATADALIIVENLMAGKMLRVRLIDSRSGIRWADEIIPSGDAEQQSEVVSRRLAALRDKLQLPESDRLYVSVARLGSEEPGIRLDATAQTLRVLLECDLRRLPGVVVLERDQLSRLTAESALTGAEVKLKASAVLIEGGLKSGGENGAWQLSFRAYRMETGRGKEWSVSTKPEVSAARQATIKLMAETLRITKFNATAASNDELKTEAALLATRAQWLVSNNLCSEAVPLAEAALAMEVNRIRFLDALHVYNRLATDTRLSQLERCQAALRGSEIDRQWLQWTFQASPGTGGYNYGSFYTFRINPFELSDQERRVLDQIRKIRIDNFKFILASLRKHGQSAVGLITLRLTDPFFLIDSAEQFTTEVRAMFDELDYEVKAKNLHYSFRDGQFRYIFSLVADNLRRAVEVREAATKFGPRKNESWGPQAIDPLLQWLVQHDNPRIQMLGHYGLARQPGDLGVKAALKVLELWLNALTPEDGSGSEAIGAMFRATMLRLHQSGEFATWFESLLADMEKNKDVSHFVRWHKQVIQCTNTENPSQDVALAKRVVAMLDAKYYDKDLEAAAEKLKTNLTIFINSQLKQAQYAPPTSEAWSNYDVRELKFDPLDRNLYRLCHVLVDRTPQIDHPIVLVWRGQPTGSNTSERMVEVIITRLPVTGGRLTETGRYYTSEFVLPQVNVSPSGDVAVATGKGNIAVLSPTGIKQFTAKHGLPESVATNITWFNGELYISFLGGLGRLNVESGQFELLASSKTLNGVSELDGGRPYEIQALLADSDHSCLWISVEENSINSKPTRSGIWRFAEGKFQRTFSGHSRYMAWTDEGFVFLNLSPPNEGSSEVWHIFNPETMKCQTLPDLLPSHPSSVYRPGWVYVANDLISINGFLLTAAGQRFQHASLRWDHAVGRLGPGLICASYGSAQIWYVEPLMATVKGDTFRSDTGNEIHKQ